MARMIIARLEEAFLSMILVSMTMLVFAEVIARFVFSAGIHWAQELTLLLAAWFVLIGASYGVKVGAHIGVDVFVKLMPNKTGRFFSLVAIVMCLVYCGLFVYGAWIYVDKMRLIGIELEDIPIPKWIPTSALLFGFALLIFRFVQKGWNILNNKEQGLSFADEGKESLEIAEELSNDNNKNSKDNR